MVKKPRAAATATPATPAADQKAPATPAAQTPVATPATPAVQTPAQAPAQTPAQAPTQTPAAQPAARGPGAPSEDVIARVLELGFPRDDVLRALEVTWNNPDAAVDLLMMGALPPRGAAGGQQGPVAGDFDIGDDGSEDADVNPFDLIKNTPQFQQLRLLAQQNPAMLEQVLQQLPQELIQIINENQDEFIRLLQEPVQGGGAAPVEGAGQPAPRAAAGGPRAAPPGTVQIRVTPEDEAVINSLIDMTGCTKDQVLRAYALFEKDAEMTANYLLNHGHDDDPGAAFGGAGFGAGGFGGFQ